jgi:hypothetical protein
MKEKAHYRNRNIKEIYLNMHRTTFKCSEKVEDDRMKA